MTRQKVNQLLIITPCNTQFANGKVIKIYWWAGVLWKVLIRPA